jgi:hypothetical protein
VTLTTFQKNEIFSILHSTFFQSYSFEEQAFKCSPFTSETRIEIADYVFGTRLTTNNAIELEFLNASEIKQLPLDEETAGLFIKERKNYKNGKVDRSIVVKVSFLLKGLYVLDNASNKSACILTANILQVDYYDSNELTDTPLASITTSYKKTFDEITSIKKEHSEMKEKLANQTSANVSEDVIIEEIKQILGNSSINNELKASLIKATIEYYYE